VLNQHNINGYTQDQQTTLTLAIGMRFVRTLGKIAVLTKDKAVHDVSI